MLGRNILILRPTASDFASPGTLWRLLMANRPRFWAPETHAERRPFLIARGEIARAVRDLFAVLEFVEVETATLQVSPGNETHIHAMRTELISPTGRDRRYLRTSPEFACKKLLARRRAADLRVRALLPQSRERAAASSRIHHARMVPRARPVRTADGRLHGGDGLRRADRRHPPVHLSRSQRRSRSPSPSGSRWPRRSTAMPGST